MLSGNLPDPLPKTLPGAVVSEASIPPLSMTTFLTVKEAAKRTGKSPSSVRRIIYPILENDQHPDRHHIEPDVDEAKALRIKGENFAWKISEKLLRREVPEGARKDSSESKAAGQKTDDGSAALIEMLRGELEIKNQQIAAQNELTKSLSERLREGNILMGSLQQQISLTDGSSRKKSEAVDAEATPEKPKQGSDAPEKSPTKQHWLFRKIF
jgi:hypothetical protein